jgi:hypothetical protein
MKLSKSVLWGVIFVLSLTIVLLLTKKPVEKITFVSDKGSVEAIKFLQSQNRKKDSTITLMSDSLKISRKKEDSLVKKNTEISKRYDKKYRDITHATLRGKDSILRANLPNL